MNKHNSKISICTHPSDMKKCESCGQTCWALTHECFSSNFARTNTATSGSTHIITINVSISIRFLQYTFVHFPTRYDLLLRCWLEEPRCRPNFTEIVKELNEQLESMTAEVRYRNCWGKIRNILFV